MSEDLRVSDALGLETAKRSFELWQESTRNDCEASARISELLNSPASVGMAVVLIRRYISRLVPSGVTWRLEMNGDGSRFAVVCNFVGLPSSRERVFSDFDPVVLVFLLQSVDWERERARAMISIVK